MRERLAQGHDTSLQAVPGWDLPTLAGAGALRSTANDMMRFLDACQGKRRTELRTAIASLVEVRRQTDIKGMYAAAGWFVETAQGDELVVKDGGTGGYTSFVGYSMRTGIAVVLLSNTQSLITTPMLGRHLLNANLPLPTLYRQVPIDPGKLSAYAGRYPLTPHFMLTVTPKDGHLMVQATGQGEFEVFPESDTRFFYRVVDAQITFELAPDGTASALVLYQAGIGGGTITLRSAPTRGRCSRRSGIGAFSLPLACGKGLLTETTAATQARWPEPVFMPHSGH